jgi:hypothetical protein
MRLAQDALNFIEFIDNRNIVNPSVRRTVLGTAWKARTEPDMIRHAVYLVQWGYQNLNACRDIITRINKLRGTIGVSNAGLGVRPVNFVLHDEISGFDSEAGMDKCGTICVNLSTRAGWLDINKNLWYVPVFLIVYHELGHYLQYLSNPAEYERAANHEAATGMHLLDAMNLPDNEYPICREIGIGVRELYTVPRDKEFLLAQEPDDVRRAREHQEQLAREAKGLKKNVGKIDMSKFKFINK